MHIFVLQSTFQYFELTSAYFFVLQVNFNVLRRTCVYLDLLGITSDDFGTLTYFWTSSQPFSPLPASHRGIWHDAGATKS